MPVRDKIEKTNIEKGKSTMHKLRMFLLGSFLGGLVGGVLAILFAPMSGEELRGRLSETFGNMGNEMRQAAEEREEELRRELSSLEG